ncbi:MAG: mechanosensitive ion channel [Lewinellaceae bacterium]|nr:mechanosensitive ion channel [Saprospiraceae bacterium]MCB9316904.1 mechanosensitive ion channel [Lewinellaceae bacterium]MCB9331620.1 mechanosensitive ion channel [Lewinellaceae bacterium]
MKYLILLVKAITLVLLLLLYLGELEPISLLAGLKARYKLAQYYIDVVSGIAIFLLLLDFVQVLVVNFYRRRHRIRGDDNFVVGIGQIYSIVLVLGLGVGLLSLFQIQIREVLTSLSIIFAGLVLLTKDYVSNMINGMIMTFSGELSIGDNIRIGQHRGKIVDITLQNIHLINDDDDVIYIPNSVFLTTDIVNFTKREIKRTSLDFEIDLKYLETVEELERILIEALQPYQDLIKENSYYLRVAEVNRMGVVMKFQYILKEPNKDLERAIRRTAIRRLVKIISGREKFVDKIPELPDEFPGHA